MKKNILFLNWVAHVGGAEKVLLELAKSLQGRCGLYLATQEEGELCDGFRRLGAQVFVVKMPAWRKFKYIFARRSAVRHIAGIIKDKSIDLVYANSYRLNPYAVHAAKACRIKSAVHIHDLIEERHVRNFLLRQASYVLVPSQALRAYVKSLQEKMRVISNAVDIDRFASGQPGKIKKEFHLQEDEALVVMISHFAPRKGHKVFIEAALRILQEKDRVRFMVVGDNMYQSPVTLPDLKGYAQDHRLRSKMIFTGRRNDIPDILRDADILVFPSSRESFGLVVAEAMAAKVPVVADLHSGGPAEIIGDSRYGMLVDCSKGDVLAAAILTLINDRSLRHQLAQNGFERVKSMYAMPSFRKAVLGAFEEMLGGIDDL